MSFLLISTTTVPTTCTSNFPQPNGSCPPIRFRPLQRRWGYMTKHWQTHPPGSNDSDTFLVGRSSCTIHRKMKSLECLVRHDQLSTNVGRQALRVFLALAWRSGRGNERVEGVLGFVWPKYFLLSQIFCFASTMGLPAVPLSFVCGWKKKGCSDVDRSDRHVSCNTPCALGGCLLSFFPRCT